MSSGTDRIDSVSEEIELSCFQMHQAATLLTRAAKGLREELKLARREVTCPPVAPVPIKSKPGLLTVPELLSWLNISRTTLHHMRKRGFPKPARVSERRIAFYITDVEEWLASRRGSVSPD